MNAAPTRREIRWLADIAPCRSCDGSGCVSCHRLGVHPEVSLLDAVRALRAVLADCQLTPNRSGSYNGKRVSASAYAEQSGAPSYSKRWSR